jgi:hypothetical protein
MTDRTEENTEENRIAQAPAGLCAACGHARRIVSTRDSIFYLCELSATDPCFPKYPRLPVLECSGYVQRT